MENRNVNMGSELYKEQILRMVRKLLGATQIEKGCDKQKATDEVCYFLKQLIVVLTSKE